MAASVIETSEATGHWVVRNAVSGAELFTMEFGGMPQSQRIEAKAILRGLYPDAFEGPTDYRAYEVARKYLSIMQAFSMGLPIRADNAPLNAYVPPECHTIRKEV